MCGADDLLFFFQEKTATIERLQEELQEVKENMFDPTQLT